MRLGAALVIASVIVGGVLGPGNLLLNRLETALIGGELWYPDWMYWQAAFLEIALGLLIAGLASFAAVLLRPRPSARSVLRRLMVGPAIAGSLLVILSLMWGGAGLHRVLAMTAFACAMFMGVGVLARVTRVGPAPAGSPAPPT